MRPIDADAYRAEMKIRQDACAEWRDEAKSDRNEELYVRAEQALATFIEAKLTLDKMPTIDAVPVVRCRECVHCNYDTLYGERWCDGRMVFPFHFCGYGKRKESDNDV